MTDIPKDVIEAAKYWNRIESDSNHKDHAKCMAQYILAQQPDPRICVVAKVLYTFHCAGREKAAKQILAALDSMEKP